VATGRSATLSWSDSEVVRLTGSGDDNLLYAETAHDGFAIVEGAPTSATVSCEREVRVKRGEWRTCVRTVSTLSATSAEFHLTNVLESFEGADRVFVRAWATGVPRDFP